MSGVRQQGLAQIHPQILLQVQRRPQHIRLPKRTLMVVKTRTVYRLPLIHYLRLQLVHQVQFAQAHPQL